MNPDQTPAPRPPQPPRPLSSVPQRPDGAVQVPQRGIVAERAQASTASAVPDVPPTPVVAQVPSAGAVPPTPTIVDPVPHPVSTTEAEATSGVSSTEMISTVEATARKKTLQPINEAEVLRVRALADEEVRVAQPQVAQAALPTDGSELQPSQTYPDASSAAAKRAMIADEIERGPDNAPVPAVKTTVQDFLPPVLDKDGNIDNKVEEDAFPVWRLLIAGLIMPIIWLAAEYGLRWVLNEIMGAQIKSAGSVESVSSLIQTWQPLFNAIPFVTLALTAIIGYFIVRYPHKGYRILLAAATIVFAVGLVQLLPHISALKDIVLSTSTVSIVLAHLHDSMYMHSISMTALWTTVAVILAAALIASFGFYSIVRWARFKFPGLVIVLAIVIVAALPVAITVPIVAEEREAAKAHFQQLLQSSRSD